MSQYMAHIPEAKRFELVIPKKYGDEPLIISKQIQDNQYETLQRLVANCFCANMQTAEIGSWTGLSAVLIGEVVQRARGTHHAIDWYQGNKKGEGNITKEFTDKYNVAQRFLDNIEFFNLTDTVKQIIKSSEEASGMFGPMSLDFIFIDGEHYYESIIKDFELWYPKIKRNKVICGHDAGASPEALQYIFNEYRLPQYIENDIWWITKP